MKPLSQLNSVAAFSPADVWVVGDSGFPNFTSRPLAEHWNGSAWSVSLLPPLPAGVATAELQRISGASPGDVRAVGSFIRESGADGILLLHWNGTSWSQVTPPAGLSAPEAVDAISASDVWVVGGDTSAHWNGTS